MKNNIYAGIIVALAIAISSLLTSCDKSTNLNTDVFDAIPENSSLVIRTENIDSLSTLISEGNALTDMFYSPKSEIAAPICCIIDSLKKAGLFGNHLAGNAAIAVRKDGNSGLCQLYTCPTDLSDKDSETSISDSIKRTESAESRIYNECEIIKYRLQPSGKTIHLSFVNGLLLASSSQRYMEDAILCLTGSAHRLSDDELFAKAFATSGKNELANLMISTKKFTNIFASELFEDNTLVQTINEIDSWASFDLITGKPLTLNGFDFPKADSAGFTSIIRTQPAIEFNSLSVIPEKSAAYVLMSFANPQKYDEALDAYLATTGKLDSRKKIVAEMNKAFGFDAKERFYSIIKHEFAYVATENSDEAEQGTVVICGLQSQSAAEMELRKMVGEDKISNLGEDLDASVFEMPYDDIPSALFGELFSNCRGKYVCCIGNFMVFANSTDDLRLLADEITLNNTMKANLAHSDFRNNFSTSSTMFAYFSFAKGSEILKRMLSRQYATDIETQKYSIGEMGSFGIQMKEVDEMMYCNISLVESDQPAVADKQSSWETNIGTDLVTKPYIVTNHDTGEKEIIVQDQNNVLYLINSSGREIWHIQIDDRIIGDISQVDSYKNDKLQYIFSTKDKIYIVDRLGNFMPKFPLQLRAEASSPIAVFDYENNRNYRIMVACNDKHVYLYDISGNLIKGWNFGETENTINSEISHYVISGEDFIVFHDNYKIYFVARNGAQKMEFQTNFKFSDNNIYCDLSSSAKFVTTDENGTIHRFYKSNKQDSVSIRKFSAKHNFALSDIDSDGKPEYIFTDSTKISVYNTSSKLLFEHDFGATVSKPYIYRFGRGTKIGVVAENKKIYLINLNGTMHEGFPLDGTTPFSIYEADTTEGTYNLLTGLSNGRLCNYKITK